MSYSAVQQAERRAAFRSHTIEEVRFSQARAQGLRDEDAPLLCSCGAVVTSGTWDLHRGRSRDAERKWLHAEAKR